MYERVFLALGSNLGNREQALASAIARLRSVPGTSVERVAKTVETPALLPANAPAGTNGPFLNTVVEVRTSLEPLSLMNAVKQIEREMGRNPAPRWSERIIDIDIVLYGERRMVTEGLTLPHPEAHAREFVLIPLSELLNTTVQEAREAVLRLRA